MWTLDKEHIIREIKRTAVANGGYVLGWRRFEAETGIRYHDWYGLHWSRWGDAVREAGLEPNRMSEAFDENLLVEHLAMLTRRLQRVPTQGDVRLESNRNADFPSEKTFRRLGSKSERAQRVLAFCKANSGHEDVATLWNAITMPEGKPEIHPDEPETEAVGFVYLFRHGTRREYKIGRTNNPLRREGEVSVQLPEKLEPIHHIKTDDPAGIEAYWHARFASKRKEGEWFALTANDVRAFRRWRCIY